MARKKKTKSTKEAPPAVSPPPETPSSPVEEATPKTESEEKKEISLDAPLPLGELLPLRKCPNRHEHDEGPDGLYEWHLWRIKKEKTHNRLQCSGCGRWNIYEKKKKGK